MYAGEGLEDKEEMETFKEAVRRGVKRLQYKKAWKLETGDLETGEDTKELGGVEEERGDVRGWPEYWCRIMGDMWKS